VKLYTRTGDAGETSLFGGQRVLKSDGRVDAYGEVDETNAAVGAALSLLPAGRSEVREALEQIQRDLFAVGARLADPAGTIASRVEKVGISDDAVRRLEELIDASARVTPPLRTFILPGGDPAAALLHVARAVCRRAERRIVALTPAPDEIVVRYMNRLSDLLFTFARQVNAAAGAAETPW
jgi:cob(I)alamin adenosyltransferase